MKKQDDLPWITTVAPPHVPSCCDPGNISGNARFEVISVISVRQGRPHLFLHLVTLVMLGCPSCPNQDRFPLHVIPLKICTLDSRDTFQDFSRPARPAQAPPNWEPLASSCAQSAPPDSQRKCLEHSWKMLKGVFAVALVVDPDHHTNLTLGRMLEMYLTQRLCRASIAKCWNVRLGSVQQAGTSPPVS